MAPLVIAGPITGVLAGWLEGILVGGSGVTKVLGDLLITKFDGYFGDGEEFIWTPDGMLAAPALT
jgi:hypothetical protein